MIHRVMLNAFHKLIAPQNNSKLYDRTSIIIRNYLKICKNINNNEKTSIIIEKNR